MTDLRPLYREMAETGDNFQGLSVLQHADEIGRLIRQFGVVTMLDFGCGRGNSYRPPHEIHKAWGVAMPTLYDPAFSTHDALPAAGAKFDFVICSDVLEHVPRSQVDEFVAGLFDLSRRIVWASVCCRPAKKSFPDGTNLHVTVEPITWWEQVFEKHAEGRAADWVLRETP